MHKKPTKKNPVGRPKKIVSEDDRKRSFTASMKVGDHKKIETKYGSLTEAIQTEIIPKLKTKNKA